MGASCLFLALILPLNSQPELKIIIIIIIESIICRSCPSLPSSLSSPPRSCLQTLYHEPGRENNSVHETSKKLVSSLSSLAGVLNYTQDFPSVFMVLNWEGFVGEFFALLAMVVVVILGQGDVGWEKDNITNNEKEEAVGGLYGVDGGGG